jgi:hypothetical protein
MGKSSCPKLADDSSRPAKGVLQHESDGDFIRPPGRDYSTKRALLVSFWIDIWND